MPDENTEAELRLEKLADRLRRGWAKMHAVKAKEMEVVRQAVREQWDEEQKIAQTIADSKQPRRAKKQQPEQQESQKKDLDQQQNQQSRTKSKDIDHGHSY